MLKYKNFNQLNESAIDGMISNIVEEKLLEFLTNENEFVFLELKEDVNGILMTDEDGNFEYIDEEEYVTLMEHFNVIDEDEGWCVGTVDPIALSGIYENEDISDLKECVLRIFLDEQILESFIDDVYARVDEKRGSKFLTRAAGKLLLKHNPFLAARKYIERDKIKAQRSEWAKKASATKLAKKNKNKNKKINEVGPLAAIPAIGGILKGVAGATLASIPVTAGFEAGSRAYKSVRDKKKFNSEKEKI